MITLFCKFLCRVCTATRRKDQILSLIENGEGKSINFSITTDLKISRRQLQRERQKNRFNKQNNNFAYAVHFFVHFFAVKKMHEYNVKMPHFTFYRGFKKATTTFSYSL